MSRIILVTGGAGNVGGSLVRELVKNPDNFVVVVDNLSTGDLNKMPDKQYPNWRFIKADTNDFNELSAIMTSFRFDYVFHYSAVVGVKRTLANPIKVLHDIEGIKNMLSLAKNTGVKRTFFSSSSEVYGEPYEIPQNEETTPLNARLPYAIVKQTGECFIRSYYREYGLDYTIFRFFNTYGPLQSNDFVVPKFVNSALKGEDIPIYGKGEQTRTFCYIDDNIETTIKILNEGSFRNDVINVGSDFEISILELAELVIEKTGSSSKVIHLPALKEGDMTRRRPDNSKMKSLLNRPLVSVEEGIQKMIDFHRKRMTMNV
ncbi:MAG: NAD-dependent epimerase/dehydratase family protein [Bacteroidetes bacterium]|nr:NAD-dependent epimerase/dehydratase family protein [Bacteroidota bacterium]